MATQNSKLSKQMLLSVNEGLPGPVLTSGSLVSGTTYTIGDFNSGDDFANVGGTNASGTTFKSTGTTPTTWTNASLLRAQDVYVNTLPDPSYKLTNTGAIRTYGHKGNTGSYWSFDGVDDKIAFGVNGLGTYVNNASGVTVSFRLNIRTVVNATEIVFFKEIAAGGLTGIGIALTKISASTFKIVVRGRSVSTDGTQAYTSTAIYNTGTDYDVKGVFDFANDQIKLYVDGALEGTLAATFGNAAFTIASPNTGDFIFSDNVTYLGGNVNHFMLFNYALSASDVTYYSNPANHLKAVDQGATGAELLTNPGFTGSASSWDLQAGWAYTTNEVAATNSSDYITQDVITAGNNYRISAIGTIASGGFKFRLGTAASSTTQSSGTSWSEDFTNVGSATTGLLGVGFTGTITSVSVIKLGCVLNLTAEGMLSQSLWRDYYNSIDVAVGTASTAPRLVKNWAGMNSWRFNGTTSVLSKTSASDGLTGDITISGWFFATGYGESNSGRIIDNSKFKLAVQNSDKLLFARDGTANVLSDVAFSLNSWTHFTVTSTSTGESKFYINGVLNNTVSAGTPASGTNWYIGDRSASDTSFDGIIEGLTITKGIWSAEQIALAYSIYQD